MTKTIIKAASGIKTERVPIWFMRQAGRYLPEFMEMKRKFDYSFLRMCFDADAVREVTLQPIKRFDLDAAILFSDILIVPNYMGYALTFGEGGPTIGERGPIKQGLYDPIAKALGMIRAELDQHHSDVSLIGFAGAPWTVACYIIEGKLTKDFHKVKRMMYVESERFAELIDEITKLTIEYLSIQIESGAEVIKLFDSWAGMLETKEFRKWVIAPAKSIINHIRVKYPHIKTICFPRGASFMYKEYADQVKPDVMALDQFVDIAWAKDAMNVVLQGNLDNILAASSGKLAGERAIEIVRTHGTKPFIFNMGHGVIPSTPVENIQTIIASIRNDKIK